MEKTVHPNNEKNITLTKSCQVEESYVDPYDANSPDVIFPVTITRTPLEKITCTSPINGYKRLVKINVCTYTYILHSMYSRNYFVLVTYVKQLHHSTMQCSNCTYLFTYVVRENGGSRKPLKLLEHVERGVFLIVIIYWPTMFLLFQIELIGNSPNS